MKIATVLAVAIAALAAHAASASAATITVTPNTHLADSEQVEVAGTGYPASAQVFISECTRSFGGCTATLGSTTTDASGNFPATTVTVVRTFGGGPIDCNVEGCLVIAGVPAVVGANAPISFASGDPAAPTGLGTNPGSGSDDNDPFLLGLAELGSTVEAYTTPDCSGAPFATGPAADFASPGFQLHVVDNSTTELSSRAIDALGQEGQCSAPITYIESTPVASAQPSPAPASAQPTPPRKKCKKGQKRKWGKCVRKKRR
jgi:Neocarzinostatin family